VKAASAWNLGAISSVAQATLEFAPELQSRLLNCARTSRGLLS
jgi:hypothetical protein